MDYAIALRSLGGSGYEIDIELAHKLTWIEGQGHCLEGH